MKLTEAKVCKKCETVMVMTETACPQCSTSAVDAPPIIKYIQHFYQEAHQ